MDKARILVPTGIGDIYWVMVKLRALCRRERIASKPVITVLANHSDVGSLRSIPFLEMVPFVKVSPEPLFPIDPILPRLPYTQEVYQESFNEFGRSVYPGFHGFDYFINYNGVINSGNWLDDCDDLECEWDLLLDFRDKQAVFKKNHGKYIVLYWTFNGNYVDYQLKQFSLDNIAQSIREIMVSLDLTPVFIGADWDLKYNGYLSQLISMVPGTINLVGKTSLAQAFSVIKGSEIVIGYHSGLTNMAAAFGKKTLLLWPSTLPFCHRFPSSVPLAVVPPIVRNTTYRPVLTGGLTVDRLVREATGLLEENP
jgi:hypothetical protein